MEARSGESARAFDGGNPGLAELADGADEKVGADSLCACRRRETHLPARAFLVPGGARDGGLESDARAHAELVGRADHVVEELVLRREVAPPGISPAHRERVGVIRRVDAAARIPILVPGSADLRPAFDDGVRDAQAFEASTERDAAHAGAHDQELPGGRFRGRPSVAPRHVAGREAHLLAHHGRVIGRHLLAEARAHHLDHAIVAGIDEGGLGARLGEDVDGGIANGVADLRCEARVLVRDQPDVSLGAIRRLEPAAISRPVIEHHEQHPEIGVLEDASKLDAIGGLHAGLLRSSGRE